MAQSQRKGRLELPVGCQGGVTGGVLPALLPAAGSRRWPGVRRPNPRVKTRGPGSWPAGRPRPREGLPRTPPRDAVALTRAGRAQAHPPARGRPGSGLIQLGRAAAQSVPPHPPAAAGLGYDYPAAYADPWSSCASRSPSRAFPSASPGPGAGGCGPPRGRLRHRHSSSPQPAAAAAAGSTGPRVCRNLNSRPQRLRARRQLLRVPGLGGPPSGLLGPPLCVCVCVCERERERE